MTAALAWLAGTRAGRWLATIIAGALIALGILVRVYGAGQRAQESRTERDSLEAARSRSRTDDQIDRMGDDARRDELARWVRDDGR